MSRYSLTRIPLGLPAILIALACSGPAMAQNGPASPSGGTDTGRSAIVAPAEPATPANGAPAVRPGTPAAEIPVPLQMIERHALQIYELSKASEWDRIRTPMSSLERSIRQAPVDMVGAADFTAELTGGLRTLGQAVAAKDRTQAMHTANDITHIVARMAERIQPQVPPEVRLLAVYARQLEIAAVARDRDAQRGVVADIQQTWQSLEPKLRTQDAQLETRRLSSTIDRLERARSSRDYQRLSRSLLDDLDDVRTLYAGQPRPPAGPSEPLPTPTPPVSPAQPLDERETVD